jgi:hypothetical protein
MALVTFFRTETGFDWTQVEDYVEVDVDKRVFFFFFFFVISNQKKYQPTRARAQAYTLPVDHVT